MGLIFVAPKYITPKIYNLKSTTNTNTTTFFRTNCSVIQKSKRKKKLEFLFLARKFFSKMSILRLNKKKLRIF